MTRTTHPRLTLVIGAVLLATVANAQAQARGEAPPAQSAVPPNQAAEQLDRTPTDYVVMNRIARNVAVNDRQVVFSMRGNAYYRNDLDGACRSLTAGESRLVMHARNTGSAKMARVCDTDSFTVTTDQPHRLRAREARSDHSRRSSDAHG